MIAHVVLILLPCALGWQSKYAKARNNQETKTTELDGKAFDVPMASCTCDMRELKCLPDSQCLTDMIHDEDHRIGVGVALREQLRKDTLWDDRQGYESYVPVFPIGKSSQYGSMQAWVKWVRGTSLPTRFENLNYMFTLDQKYDFCKQNHLRGKACFFRPFNESESFGDLEKDAAARHVPVMSRVNELYANFKEHLIHARKLLEHKITGDDEDTLSAEWVLMSFAHLSRMRFNLQPTMEDSYENHLAKINPGIGSLKVGLHIRRGDSCGTRDRHKYAVKAWDLDSVAQTTGKRTCFATAVYVDVLRQIRHRYGRNLDVYLSTDDSSSILDELKREHADVYETTTWRYVRYPRDPFEYKSGDTTIEFYNDPDRQGLLGEIGVSDLWHLSNSQLFVGSLGSRFGKTAYVLAAARHNAPIPYVSVDGHSLCCEIDESCSRANTEMTNMMDCLLYAHEQVGPANKDYWEVGSTIRRPLLRTNPVFLRVDPVSS